MRCTARGGLEAIDFQGIPLELHFRGLRYGRNTIEELVIGGKDDDPKFFLDNESSHLGDGRVPKLSDMLVFTGSRPFRDNSIKEERRVVAEIYRQFERQYGITRNDLTEGDVLFLPSQGPSFGGLDRSMIVGYGNDNWSSAYALVEGLLTSKTSLTKMAIWYDREETGDRGSSSLGQQFMENYVLPAIGNAINTNIPDQYRGQTDAWSLFLDVTGGISYYNPAIHDDKLSPYMGSGVVIQNPGGNQLEDNSYTSNAETTIALRRLFRERNVMNQFGIMGNIDEREAAASDSFHPAAANGIDIGVPLLSMHRATEQVSTMDMLNLVRATRAFYSVKRMGRYFPTSNRPS